MQHHSEGNEIKPYPLDIGEGPRVNIYNILVV